MAKTLLLYLWALAVCGLVVLVVLPMTIGFPFSYKKAAVQPAAMSGECMIWSEGSGKYTGMVKLCGIDADCTSYYESFADYIAYGVSDSFDKSRIACRETSYSPLRTMGGQAISCSSDHDCFSAFFGRVRMPKGSMPQEIVNNANEVFKCDGGICSAPAGVCSFWGGLE